MTVPDTHLGEPLRPLLRRTAARALIGGVWAAIALFAIGVAASFVPGGEEVVARLLMIHEQGSFDDPAGAAAEAVTVALVFTVAIVLVLEAGDRRTVSPELTFVAVLAGVLSSVAVGPSSPDEDTSGFVGIAVTVLAIHWLVYGLAGPRRPLLPRRSATLGAAGLLVVAAGAVAWRAWAAPITPSNGNTVSWWAERPGAVAPGAADRPANLVSVPLEHRGLGRVEIVDVTSATRGVGMQPVTERSQWRSDEHRFVPFEPVQVDSGGFTRLTLVTTASCDAARRARLRLTYAGGRTSVVSLDGAGRGTCDGP